MAHGVAFPGGGLQKQPQMVSPHAASLQQPVTYTRASCEILEGRGGELTKMHIPAAAQLSPPPLQPSSSSPALPAPPRAFPACCHRSHCGFSERGVRAGNRVLLLPGGCESIPCSARRVQAAGCPLQERIWAAALLRWDIARAGKELPSPQAQLSPSTEPCCRGTAMPQKGLQRTRAEGSRTPKPLGSLSRSKAGDSPHLCFSRNRHTQP